MNWHYLWRFSFRVTTLLVKNSPILAGLLVAVLCSTYCPAVFREGTALLIMASFFVTTALLVAVLLVMTFLLVAIFLKMTVLLVSVFIIMTAIIILLLEQPKVINPIPF